jgi:hypothetical protein
MKSLLFPVLLLILNSSITFACSPGARSSFFIDLDAEVKWSSDLYPPDIKSVNVKRGQSPCDFGIIKIEILMPKNSFYQISEVGFYFIHDSNEPLESIYPDSPLIAIKNENGKFYLEYDWFDKYPKTELNTSFQLVTVLKNSSISSLSKLIVVNE